MNPREIKQIDRYPVESFIAEGGMAWVYKVTDPRFGVPRALKMLKPEAAAGEEFQRFEGEAKLLAKIDHPNLITIYDIGRDEATGCHWYTMTYVDGPPLSAVGMVDVDTAVTIFADILDALASLHDHGIVHRDIKPANIMRTSAGRSLLADLGIARDANQTAGLTRPGMAIGSVKYMSPEQARGETVGYASDVFSMGLSLYEMLTGSSVYDGVTEVDSKSGEQVMMYLGSLVFSGAELKFKFPDTVPPAIAQVIQTACRFDLEDRYPNARAMRAALLRAAEKPDETLVEAPLPGDPATSGISEVVSRTVDALRAAPSGVASSVGGAIDRALEIPPRVLLAVAGCALLLLAGGLWLASSEDGSGSGSVTVAPPTPIDPYAANARSLRSSDVASEQKVEIVNDLEADKSDAATGVLIGATENSDLQIALLAVPMLISRIDRNAEDDPVSNQLVALASAPRKEIRLRVVSELGASGHSEFAKLMTDRLAVEEDPEVHAAILICLERLAPAERDPRDDRLWDPGVSEDDKLAIVADLGADTSPQATGILMRAIDNRSIKISTSALRQLYARTDDEQVANYFRTLLHDERYRIRGLAVVGMEKSGRVDFLSDLQGLAETESDQRVKKVLEEAIRNLAEA